MSILPCGDFRWRAAECGVESLALCRMGLSVRTPKYTAIILTGRGIRVLNRLSLLRSVIVGSSVQPTSWVEFRLNLLHKEVAHAFALVQCKCQRFRFDFSKYPWHNFPVAGSQKDQQLLPTRSSTRCRVCFRITTPPTGWSISKEASPLII